MIQKKVVYIGDKALEVIPVANLCTKRSEYSPTEWICYIENSQELGIEPFVNYGLTPQLAQATVIHHVESLGGSYCVFPSEEAGFILYPHIRPNTPQRWETGRTIYE